MDRAPTDTNWEKPQSLGGKEATEEKQEVTGQRRNYGAKRGTSYGTGTQKASPQGHRTTRGHPNSILCNRGPKAKLLTFFFFF